MKIHGNIYFISFVLAVLLGILRFYLSYHDQIIDKLVDIFINEFELSSDIDQQNLEIQRLRKLEKNLKKTEYGQKILKNLDEEKGEDEEENQIVREAMISNQTENFNYCHDLQRLNFEDKFPYVALASFMGSGNTWMRHLLQTYTGFSCSSLYNDGDIRKNSELTRLVIMINDQYCGANQYSQFIAIKTHRWPSFMKEVTQWKEHSVGKGRDFFFCSKVFWLE